jgi:hypothetical protein
MSAFAKSISLAFLAVQLCAAHAVTLSTPTSFNGLTWNFASGAAGFSTCSQIVVDATGDLYQGHALGIHGYLNCSNGAYGLSGTAYIATNGTLNMTIAVGASTTVACVNLPGTSFSGTCTLYNGIGTVTGTATVNYLL